MKGSDGNAVNDGVILRVELALVEADTSSAPAARPNRDVDPTARRRPQLPQRGGGSVTQDGLRPSSQDRGHPPTLEGEARMANRIDPAVDGVEIPALDQPLDLVTAEACRAELPTRDHSMLQCGQGTNTPWAAYYGYMT